MKYEINNLKIIVKDEIIDSIRKFYWSNLKYEIGGILLGKFNDKNKIIEISEIYELKARLHSKILYKRNAKKAQKIINKRWRETEGIINYIGEWHTHPNMSEQPSRTDINSLREIHDKVRNILPGTILIIAGKDEKFSLIVQNDNKIEIKKISKDVKREK